MFFEFIIITATHDRLNLFQQCQLMQAKALRSLRKAFPETVRERFIVISDGSIHPRLRLANQTPIFHNYESDPRKSFLRNNEIALGFLDRTLISGLIYDRTQSYIVFWEDDDFYHPDYLTEMAKLIREFPQAKIFGLANSIYYHVPKRSWLNCSNTQHSSLCSTIIRADILPQAKAALESCKQRNAFTLDLSLWRDSGLSEAEKVLVTGSKYQSLVIGMKGLSPGIEVGGGHSRISYPNQDPSGEKLKELIGENNASWYFDFWQQHEEEKTSPIAPGQ